MSSEHERQRRRAKNARYRERHRTELAAKERARKAAMNPERRVQAQREASARFRERHRHDEAYKEKRRAFAKAKYERDKSDPDFVAKNRAGAAAWFRNNKGRANQRNRGIHRRRLKADPVYRLTVALRKRFYFAISRGWSSGTAIRELGCTAVELKRYLETQFAPGMSWENYGAWHIDHKRALSKFDLSNESDRRAVCHFTNLQPLWASENCKKGNR